MQARAATVFICLLLCCSASFASNLLTNPGFESHPVGVSHGEGVWSEHQWRYFSVNGAGGSFATVSPGRTGNVAVRMIRSSASGDQGLDRDGFAVPVTPGVRYRASFWAMSPVSSSVRLSVAAYDANGVWMQQQKDVIFPLGWEYAQCFTEYVAPAGCASVNFALRTSGAGTVFIDDCELDAAPVELLYTPTITYPADECVDSFRPTLGYKGPGHDAHQVTITQGSNVVWDSGAISGHAFSLSCGIDLQQGTSYEVKVRVRRGIEWSDYSAGCSFTTPAAPVVRIQSPAEADALRGPSLTLKWTAESPTGITGQHVILDEGTPVSLSPSATSHALSGLSEGVHKVEVTASSAEGTASDVSRFYVRITPAEAGTIYFHDLSYVLSYNKSNVSQRNLAYDVPMAVYALQGLVNRSGQRLWIKQFTEDTTWWNRMREPGNWLANKTVSTIPTGFSNLVTLVNTFRDDIAGVVLWDPNVYATANVACTVAGADNLVPIRYDPTPGSVYSTLVTGGPMLPVVVDLTGKFTGAGTIWDTDIPSTGSKKCDAYTWARVKYLETGRSCPEVLMYALDGYWLQSWNSTGSSAGHTLPCRDYVIQNKGFFFDLSVWSDETPVDDPYQPLGTDLSTLRSVLYAAAVRAPGMVHVVGFVPWPMKYTTWAAAGGSHDPVPTEWEYARWLSHYNAYMDADAYAHVDMANASIYSRFPLPDRLTQNRRLSPIELRKTGYLDKSLIVSPLNFLNIYMGDYDSAVWVQKKAYTFWNDSNRGQVPLSWAFNPNHIRRIAAVMEYYYRTRSDLDSFIAGDCGAGYVNPTCLLGSRLSGLPSAMNIWVQHNLKYNRATNVKMAGFLINGTNGPITSEADSMFSKFSTEGTFSQPLWYPQGNHMVGTMPALLQKRDLSGNASTDADIVFNDGLYSGPNFLNYRTILQTPSYVNSLFSNITSRDVAIPWALVDAPTYAALAGRQMGRIPDARATYTFDTVEWSDVHADDHLSGTIGIRNDGWVDWDSSYSLLLTWRVGYQTIKEQVPLPRDVPAGSGIVIDFTCEAPSQSGSVAFCYEMARNGIGFSEMGDYRWEVPVTLQPSLLLNTPAIAKANPDGAAVMIWNGIVTAGNDQFADAFYVQDEARASGIKVAAGSGSAISVSEGDRLRLTGTMTGSTGERAIADPVVFFQEPWTPLEPLGLRTSNVGGSALNEWTPGTSITQGLHNVGLLVRCWGRVTSVDDTAGCFYLDDGSGAGNGLGHVGVRVCCSGLVTGSLSMPDPHDFVAVTGISIRSTDNDGSPCPGLRPRKQADIVPLLPE